MDFDVQEIHRLIRTRRTIQPQFMDSEKQVDKGIIEAMLENANWAPTHGLTEPWRFRVFTGDGLRKLAKFQSDLYKELTPEVEYNEKKYQKLLDRPMQCSHIISIGMKRQESKKIAEIEEIEAVACAVQNMFLTATAYGVGAFWSTGGITYEEEAKEFFGLDKADKLLGYLYVGYPKRDWPEGRRNPISEKVTWID